ncbi:hypothetical protein AB6A23_16620 [Paenibacillus tarimensis]
MKNPLWAVIGDKLLRFGGRNGDGHSLSETFSDRFSAGRKRIIQTKTYTYTFWYFKQNGASPPFDGRSAILRRNMSRCKSEAYNFYYFKKNALTGTIRTTAAR